MAPQDEKSKPGPDPDLVRKAVKKNRPPEGWPKPDPPVETNKDGEDG